LEAQKIRFPEVFQPLTAPARYKGAWGGRGSGKSHFFGGFLVLSALRRQVRAVCLREVQNSIKDSVKQLIEDKIRQYGLASAFDITDAEIRGPNDSLFVFRGLKAHNADSIKSLEGFNIAWVEEAQSVSQKSLDMLIPTIRADDAELWFSWNPDQPTDAVDRFLRTNPPTDSIVVRANYTDNRFFPEVLRADMERDRQNDPAKHAHIWLGEYQVQSSAQFISWDLVKQAQDRPQKRGERPLLFGLDVARFGDDRSVLAIREGDCLTRTMVWEKLDTQQLASMVLEVANKRKPDVIFVDGVGVGGGVVDRMRALKLKVIEVNAGARAGQERRYVNKRAEMWGRMKEWLGGRGVISEWDADLAAELTGPLYGFDASNRIYLEKKEDMKKRGLKSPDIADALALTFAEPVAVPSVATFMPPKHQTRISDPLGDYR
jgi:phage terminase large subunit